MLKWRGREAGGWGKARRWRAGRARSGRPGGGGRGLLLGPLLAGARLPAAPGSAIPRRLCRPPSARRRGFQTQFEVDALIGIPLSAGPAPGSAPVLLPDSRPPSPASPAPPGEHVVPRAGRATSARPALGSRGAAGAGPAAAGFFPTGPRGCLTTCRHRFTAVGHRGLLFRSRGVSTVSRKHIGSCFSTFGAIRGAVTGRRCLCFAGCLWQKRTRCPPCATKPACGRGVQGASTRY